MQASIRPTDIPATAPSQVTNARAVKLAALLSIPAEEWYEKPWKERKTIVEDVFHEARSLSGIRAEWGGWNRRQGSLGITKQTMTYWDQTPRTSIELSDTANRHTTPATFAKTIAHELAHARAGNRNGHNAKWAADFAAVNEELGLATEIHAVHRSDEVETAQWKKLQEEKAAKPPVWLGLCAQGHRFGAGRKVTRSHLCVKCLRAGHPRAEAAITYTRNINKETV
ncbi:SprT-like domain-containing protein [Agrococcus sediminis]|uniref:SprT-like domain-containing protein n=1 Tax=Agrococcus sediminis TaxID=2599924 RepID=UPI001788CD46|nr:SprT-like domain-containing protein [Agrococcus sediminis]